MRRSLAFALLLLPASVCAQQGAKTVAPGMTKSQVTNVLGEPATMRTANDYTYLFYLNTCGKRCGMNDLVVLHGDSVVDAIFRSPTRHYSGVSSSPTAIPPNVARHAKPGAAGEPMKMPTEPPAKAKTATKATATPKTTTTPKPSATKPAATDKPAAAKSGPAAKPTQMKPGPANDIRPSIPVNPPALKPATPKPAATKPAATKPASRTP